MAFTFTCLNAQGFNLEEMDCKWYSLDGIKVGEVDGEVFPVRGFASGTEIYNWFGAHIPMEKFDGQEKVYGWDARKSQCVFFRQGGYVYGERDDFVRVTFQDGTQLVNTPEIGYWVKHKGWASVDPLLTKENLFADVRRLSPGDTCVANELVGEDIKVIASIEPLSGQRLAFSSFGVEGDWVYFANDILVSDGNFPEQWELVGENVSGIDFQFLDREEGEVFADPITELDLDDFPPKPGIGERKLVYPAAFGVFNRSWTFTNYTGGTTSVYFKDKGEAIGTFEYGIVTVPGILRSFSQVGLSGDEGGDIYDGKWKGRYFQVRDRKGEALSFFLGISKRNGLVLVCVR